MYTSIGINPVSATNPKALSDGLRGYPIITPTSINIVGISGSFKSSGRIPHIGIIDFSSRREGQDTQEELEKRDLKQSWRSLSGSTSHLKKMVLERTEIVEKVVIIC
ncbi:hypothetical protein Tco_0965179 [Tanacetum coccineum]